MATVISILIVLCCLILILAVLVQNPKGGGLASGLQSGSQVMGVRRTADFLEKATWTLAVLLFVFSIGAATYSKRGATSSGTENSSSVTKGKAGQFSTPASGNSNPLNLGGGNQPAPGGNTAPPAGGGK